MNKIFLLFLSLSLSGSLIALCLFILKPFIKQHISKTWQYYISLIVIFRYLLPLGFETNLVGMMFDQAEGYTITESTTSQSENVMSSVQSQTDEIPLENYDKPVTLYKTNTIQFILKWCWLVWIIPAVLLFIRKIIIYNRFLYTVKTGSKQIISTSVLTLYDEVCEKMNIKHAPGLFYNPRIATPMLVGIFRPAIVLPHLNDNKNELSYILQHELTHYKRFDIGYKWLVQVAVCIHWFNPLIHISSREIERNCELSCDEVVIQQLDNKEQRIYGDMLLNTIQAGKQHHNTFMTLTLGEDVDLIKERLDAIMKFQKKSKAIIVVSIILAAAICSGAAFAGGYYGSVTSSEGSGNKLNRTDESATGRLLPYDEQSLVYEQVEMRQYEGEDGHPYIHDIMINSTDKTITGYQHGMLAFDKDGNPLEIDWWSLDTDYNPSYYYLYSVDSLSIVPGQRGDESGGFSLDFMGIDPEVKKSPMYYTVLRRLPLKMVRYGLIPIMMNGWKPIMAI